VSDARPVIVPPGFPGAGKPVLSPVLQAAARAMATRSRTETYLCCAEPAPRDSGITRDVCGRPMALLSRDGVSYGLTPEQLQAAKVAHLINMHDWNVNGTRGDPLAGGGNG